MSVKLHFDSPSNGSLIQRSRSFTGFSSLTGQWRPPSVRHSLRSKSLISNRAPRMHLYPSRVGGVMSRVGGVMSGQPPEQVDGIFRALRDGLQEYLEVHQTEMDFLSSHQRETKRNSRLAFLYDLEKEMRALERYIRRLEFHMSKLEELYEMYCIQWRLSQGAINMKKAFSLSPSTRASRDSLLELSRTHTHSLQDMSAMEGELEILLGELHIKMKGLIGFARLCPGDQFEVVVRLGRQRWRIRGKIQSDDSQLWDEEEMVFLPHTHHNFEIKVTEAKGLSQLLVGMVTCASADFFVARPQLMLVDVTELGTIKLQLEVTWNPFDSVCGDRLRPVSSRRKSSYSRTSTSFTEKYFISMVHLQDGEGSMPSLTPRARPSRGGVSLLSYMSDPTLIPADKITCSDSPLSPTDQPSQGSDPSQCCSLGGSHPQLSLGVPSLTELPSGGSEKRRRAVGEGGEEKEGWVRMEGEGGEGTEEHWRGGETPFIQLENKTLSLLAPPRCSTPDILRKNPVGELDHRDLQGIGPSPAPVQDTDNGQGSTEDLSAQPSPPAGGPWGLEVSGPQRRLQAARLGVLITRLETLLHHQEAQEKELRALNSKVNHLATILKNNLSLLKKPSSAETLAVDEVLESFDFLSNDLNAEDDTSCMGSLRLKDTGQSASEEEQLPVAPLTSGNWSLDQALETHLDICSIILEALATVDSSGARRYLLEETVLQHDVLETASRMMLENDHATDILPKRTKDLSLFWDDCVADDDTPFCCHVDSFSRSLRKRYTHKLKAKHPGQSEKGAAQSITQYKGNTEDLSVFKELLEQIQASSMVVPCLRPACSPDRVTVFQLSVYLQRWGIQDLGQHISRLAWEVYLLSALQSSKRRRALKKLRGRGFAELLPLGVTLETLAGLQMDSSLKVCKAASRCLARGFGCKAFRNKAVVFYTESLKQNEVKIQQASCLALKHLRATESVQQVAELWRSEDEDVRNAARETVLSFGKKGYSGFQKMDQLNIELQDETYQNQYTQITIL
ncbi:RIPOR family member 3 isoform X2 [Gadus morhua]|uniref:RIPOR family member 3 isoform X2 n=1 Tax=Gadus morhua TaxID=8049 RepID=UPI0011B5D920|nr:RIPOR family member 3-like isoform X2 [Gadus morhua]